MAHGGSGVQSTIAKEVKALSNLIHHVHSHPGSQRASSMANHPKEKEKDMENPLESLMASEKALENPAIEAKEKERARTSTRASMWNASSLAKVYNLMHLALRRALRCLNSHCR